MGSQGKPRGTGCVWARCLDEVEHISLWLAGRDATCPVCNYNLRDLRRPVCPECAAPLRLTIASGSLGRGPWIVSVVSMALAVVIDGVVSILLGLSMALGPAPPMPAAWLMLIVLLVAFVVLALLSGAGLVLACRLRRRWAFWTRERQWLTGFAVLLVISASHGAIGAAVARWGI